MIGRALRATTSLLLAAVMVATAAVGTVSAAKEKATPAPIQTTKGDDYRVAKRKVAESVTRIDDAEGDQALSNGEPATDAPKWSDISAVYVAPSKLPAKLRTQLGTDFPPGTARSFYGDAANWKAKDRLVFVAVEMAKRLPAESAGQQVEVGIAGNEATPVQAGTDLDLRSGVERFELSGLFSNGAYATGSTDVSGRQPGEGVEYYNAESGVFGFYEPSDSTWYLLLPRPGDADAVSVSVHSSTGAGQVIDRLELPGGGHFINLRNPNGGFGRKSGLPPLSCRSLETFSAASDLVELSDPEATLVRYTAGVDADLPAREAAKLLASAVEAVGPVAVTLTPLGEDAEPLTIEGDLAVSPDGTAVSLTFEAPAGQWRFKLADGLQLKTPAGESIIDHTTLTGSEGVLTGPGLDGYVAGDLSCAQAADEPVATEEAAG